MNKYSSIWTPSHCLSKAQLLDYIQQKLDTDEIYLVESHINDCVLCSDALDGLMLADIDETQAHIESIKKEFELKIAEAHPQVQKLIATPSKKSNNKNWLVAASVLLVIGLGGYSVFSYIKSQENKLAINEQGSNSSTTNAEYNKNNSNTNEITTISVKPDEETKPLASSDRKDSKADAADVSGNEKTIAATPKLIKSIPIATSKDELQQEQKQAKPNTMKSDVRDEEVANIEPMQEASNYNEYAKAPAPQKTLAKKSSDVGLSKRGYSNNIPSSNQLSYPSTQNNYQNYNTTNAAAPEDKVDGEKEIALDAYEQGLALYNKGEFKKSISYFEKALENKQGVVKEDIQYQLALAYQNTGNYSKAQKLFKQLASGTKYKVKANEYLEKAKK